MCYVMCYVCVICVRVMSCVMKKHRRTTAHQRTFLIVYTTALAPCGLPSHAQLVHLARRTAGQCHTRARHANHTAPTSADAADAAHLMMVVAVLYAALLLQCATTAADRLKSVRRMHLLLLLLLLMRVLLVLMLQLLLAARIADTARHHRFQMLRRRRRPMRKVRKLGRRHLMHLMLVLMLRVRMLLLDVHLLLVRLRMLLLLLNGVRLMLQRHMMMAEYRGRITAALATCMMQTEHFQITAYVVRHLAEAAATHAAGAAQAAVLVALLHACGLMLSRLVALIVHARKDEHVQDQQTATDRNRDAERRTVRRKTVAGRRLIGVQLLVRAADAGAAVAAAAATVARLRAGVLFARILCGRRHIEERKHLRRDQRRVVVRQRRIRRRRIQRLDGGVVVATLALGFVLFAQLMVRQRHLIVAGPMQVGHEIQPERQPMRTIVVLEFRLVVCVFFCFVSVVPNIVFAVSEFMQIESEAKRTYQC